MKLLRLLKRRPRLKLEQTQEGIDKQADEFLASHGFPVDDDHRQLVGSYIQQAPANEDEIDTEALSRCIRKAKANAFAFYLIKPNLRPKKEEPKDVSTKEEL
jgi:hypothetical protein